MATNTNLNSVHSVVLKTRVSIGTALALRKAARLAGMKVTAHRSEVLEAYAADTILKQIPENFLLSGPPCLENVRRQNNGNDYHRTSLSAEQIQQVLHLRDSENLSTEILAKRFGVGYSTIRRIVEARKTTGREHPAVIRRGNRSRSPKAWGAPI